MIRYSITSHNLSAHYFSVQINIPNPDQNGQLLRLPNWIPGSYMIRDFAKNIVEINASCDGQSVKLKQIDKSNWLAEKCKGELQINYLVYAWDLSVRTAHVDRTHAFFNGTSVFLEIVDQSDLPCEVVIERPQERICEHWKVATSLTRKQAQIFGFGSYQALNYDDLIDHPVEMGLFRQLHFEACGVPHDIVLTGRFDCDEDRLIADLTRICESHIRFFGEPAPVDYYLFLVMVVGEGYGGLEHRSSTSLLCSRDDLPQPGERKQSERYRNFLGLCSHEYFHTWNVKRIKPAAFQPCQLQQEVYSELLWAFEGFTSYYDDLALLRCGLIDLTAYLELLGQTISRVLRGQGRLRQSAAESSFNAWTKFYKQDENSQNAIVSYYAKGTLIALCIDLKMRELSNNQKCLDDVMAKMWANYQADGKGVGENQIQTLICDILDQDIQPFLQQIIRQTSELPLQPLLENIGIDLQFRAAINQQDKGGKPASDPVPDVNLGISFQQQNGVLRIQRLVENGPAQKAGLSAGDEILALNGLKVTLQQLEQKLLNAAVGDHWTIHAFRRDELFECELQLQAAQLNTAVLSVTEDFQSEQEIARQSWING